MGDCFTLILTKSKEVYTMGTNIDNQLGHRQPYNDVPKKIQMRKKVESISCGLNHIIITTQSKIYGWGSNRFK